MFGVSNNRLCFWKKSPMLIKAALFFYIKQFSRKSNIVKYCD